MANKYRGEAVLTVGERELHLVFDCNAVCALEQQVGLSFVEFAAKTGSGQTGFLGTRALLWAGLQARHKGLTLERCGDIISDVGMKLVLETCWSALRHVFPEPDEGNAVAAVESNGIGTPSSSPLVAQA
ncbi:MAG: hypothetical protein ACREIL_00020 [Nitrospiraceae bacterium]